MSNKRPSANIEMVNYMGKNVPKKHFRAFVYDMQSNAKLANSWDEFTKLVSSGVWFQIPQIKTVKRSAKK